MSAPRASTWLLDKRRDVFSQTGEDGVLEAALALLPDRDLWCVEFGAWDGLHCSNTRHLIENQQYHAVLIEADAAKFSALQTYCAGRDGVFAVNRFVGYGPDDNLDAILAPTAIPRCFDFLSIDIDGNDYHVWKALRRYRPKLVCIEFNPTMPTELAFVQPARPDCNIGSSLLALVQLGHEMGYELVCALDFNAIFVRREDFPRFEITCNAPSTLRRDVRHLSYVCVGYDGRVFLAGNRTLPWHGLELADADVQALPRWLRHFPPAYSGPQRLAFKTFKKLTQMRRSARQHLARVF